MLSRMHLACDIQPAAVSLISYHRKALLNCVLHGISYATANAAYFLLLCLVMRFGSFLITLPEDNIAHITFVDVFVAFTALSCGSIATGQFGAYAPNYVRGRVSANRIFHLLDRKPLIDSYSQSGVKLVSALI